MTLRDCLPIALRPFEPGIRKALVLVAALLVCLLVWGCGTPRSDVYVGAITLHSHGSENVEGTGVDNAGDQGGPSVDSAADVAVPVQSAAEAAATGAASGAVRAAAGAAREAATPADADDDQVLEEPDEPEPAEDDGT